jgi:hypothetical protein
MFSHNSNGDDHGVRRADPIWRKHTLNSGIQ